MPYADRRGFFLPIIKNIYYYPINILENYHYTILYVIKLARN